MILLLSVVRIETFANFVGVGGDFSSKTYILVESVFALSLSENVEVFECKRTTNSTHFLFSYVAIHLLAYLPHTIQVWGIASFILTLGHSTTFT